MFRATIFLLSGMYLLPVIGNPLDDTFKCHADDQSTALAVRIDQGNSSVYRNAIGHSDLFKSIKSQPDHPFQIGSITKQFTAAAILKLAEQYKLQLNDGLGSNIKSVSEYLAKITIKQLLSHNSGLSDYFTKHVMS